VNFVSSSCFVVRILKNQVVLALFLAVLFSIYLVGCSEQVRLPSAEQLAEFEKAGPIQPTVDMDRLVRAKMGGGSYRVVPGDVLELTMPTILQVVTAERMELPEGVSPFTPYLCRVSESGSITLPIVGQIEVAGKSLAEIESAIIDAYHPKYIGDRPSVLARVAEYKTASVSISGAVTKPGVYELRSDRMSLVALLMEAGGIVDEGAAGIRIIHRAPFLHRTPNGGDVLLNGNPTHHEVDAEAQNSAADSLKGLIEQVSRRIERGLNHGNVQKLAEPKENGAVLPRTESSRTNGMSIQMRFSQMNPSSTTGRLTIRHDERVLLSEQLDVTSEVQRKAMLEKLAQSEPRVSTTEVRQNIYALAETLKPGSVNYSRENKTTVARKNFGATFNVSGLKRNPISDEALHKDIIELLELEKSVGMWKTADSRELEKGQPIVLPVKGLNIPFADVALQEGDAVEVERLELPLVTVVGLVNKPGNFPYPPDAEYNLMQALGFAGGLNLAAEPRYATVYRKKADGIIVNATLKVVDSSKLTNASNVLIKPGDIVAVEHTPRTRTKLFLDRIFRLNMGLYVPFTGQLDRR